MALQLVASEASYLKLADPIFTWRRLHIQNNCGKGMATLRGMHQSGFLCGDLGEPRWWHSNALFDTNNASFQMQPEIDLMNGASKNDSLAICVAGVWILWVMLRHFIGLNE